jgi:hypothetical protein
MKQAKDLQRYGLRQLDEKLHGWHGVRPQWVDYLYQVAYGGRRDDRLPALYRSSLHFSA